MRLISFIILLFFSSRAFADDIYLRDGRVFKNVQIIDTVAGVVTFRGADKSIRVHLSDIAAISRSEYDAKVATSLMRVSLPPTRPSSSNLKLLPLAVLAFALTWDYFSQVSDIDRTMADYDKLKLDSSNLQSTKDRKMAIAVVSLVAGLITTYIAFQGDIATESPDSLSTTVTH